MSDSNRTGLFNSQSYGFLELSTGIITKQAGSVGSLPKSSFGPKSYGGNETFGVNDFTESRLFNQPDTQVVASKGELDKSLLDRAEDIIDNLGKCDTIETTIDLESLRGVTLQLWESAVKCSNFHQDILSFLESALLSIEKIDAEQISVFREAIKDLNSKILTQAHVEVLRRRFMNVGFSPLALISEIKE